jgi:N utilization substance protein B
MPSRKPPRRIARELALLSATQIRGNPEKLEQHTLDDLVIGAIRTLRTELHDTLEQAAAEVSRAEERLLSSETRAVDVQSSRAMIKDAVEMTQTAINQLGTAVDLPEFVQMSNRQEVRSYALEIVGTIFRRRQEIDQALAAAMVDWQLSRLSKVDQQILRIAVAEMLFLGIPYRVAINEAVELAKSYSDEEGHRFINGVLRRVTNEMKAQMVS